MPSLWSLRKLGRSKLAYQAAQALMLRVFPPDTARPIPMGPLKGMKWWRHRDHQFWMPLGMYEEGTARWLTYNLGEGFVFFDIGANAGYYSLLGSRRVGASGKVVAFEPVPTNIEVIHKQLELNDIENVQVEAIALANREGKAMFAIEGRKANSHLSEIEIPHAESHVAQNVEVDMTTLDAYVESTGIRPDVLKIDVEGAEVLVLEGAQRTLRELRPRILVTAHSEELGRQCFQLLDAANYQYLDGKIEGIVAYPCS